MLRALLIGPLRSAMVVCDVSELEDDSVGKIQHVELSYPLGKVYTTGVKILL